MDQTARAERFRLFYDSHYARILGYVVRRTTSAEDAADVVAEAFTICWRRFEDMPPGHEATLWLYGVARRLLANHRRRETHRREVIDRLAADYQEVIVRDPLPSDTSVVGAAWKRLRPQDRDLLGLVVWEAFDQGEIASILGCSRPVAKLRLFRARRRFARELARQGFEMKPRRAGRHVVVGPDCALGEMEGME